jgi:O-antigen/teichoic acid export membrane protein
VIFSKANFGTFSTSFIIQACGAITGVLTARLLGPRARGELATVILWPTILSNLGLMGCNWVLAREVAKDPAKESDWVAAGVMVGLGTALVYFLSGYFLIPVLVPSGRRYLVPIARICLLLIPLDICNQLLLAVDQGRMRWRRYNLLRLFFTLFYLAVICSIGVTHMARVAWFVAALLASHLVSVLLRLWIQRKALASGEFRFGRCGHLLRAGLPYFGATMSNLASLQFDTILVVSLLSTQAAGIYVVASALANGQYALGEALGITSFGLLSNERNPGSQGRIISETFRQSALISCGAGLVLVCVIPFLVVPLFGFEFSRAIRPAVVLALASALLVSTNILDQGLRGAGRPHAGLLSQLIGIGAMGLGALFLLRKFGLMGMACAVGLSACAQLVVLVAAAAKWLKISALEFWPFSSGNIKLFVQQLAELKLRYSRSLA